MLGLVSENAEEKLGLAMTLRVIIADDEPLGRARLRQLLEREPAIEIVAECATVLKRLKRFNAPVPTWCFWT